MAIEQEGVPTSAKLESTGETTNPPPPDRWRWVIVVSAFFSMFLCGSMGYITGVVHISLDETGLYGVEELAWLGSLFNCMFALTGPAASFVISMFSCRVCVVLSGVTCLIGFALSSVVTDIRLLFITYGFLAGLGRGLTYTGSLVIVGYYFPKDSSLVTGLCTTGVGLGMFVHPRLTQALLDFYGLEGTFRLIGAISFQTCVFGSLMRPSKFERERQLIEKRRKEEENPETQNRFLNFWNTFLTVVIKNVSFSFIVLGAIMFSIGFSAVLVLLPDFYYKNGATKQEAAMAASLTGLGGFISRTLVGIGSNDVNIGKMVFFSGTNGIIGTLTFFMSIFVKTLTGRYIYAFLFGTYVGSVLTLLTPITMDSVGVNNLAFGVGFMMFFTGAGCLVGPPIAVAIWQTSGDYIKAFLFAGMVFSVATLCGFLSELCKRKPPSTESVTESTLTIISRPREEQIVERF
ncbi:monocarboxylate transporter 12-like [Haliotis asinina]|uniref:monocarboxylate transporter 12-like n=1 Tax=Haliotis asinina TaxID=109174 RepID=UPI0035319EF1